LKFGPRKMLFPNIGPGIEQWRQNAGIWIGHDHAIGLAQIACRARESEITELSGPSFRTRGNMLNVKSGALKRLVHLAILAPLESANLHCLCQLVPGHGLRPRRTRALPRTMAIDSLSSTRDSSSFRSLSVNSPSVFRSIRC